MEENKIRAEIINAQKEMTQNVLEAQKIVLIHLDNAVAQGDSATVAAMAEILKG